MDYGGNLVYTNIRIIAHIPSTCRHKPFWIRMTIFTCTDPAFMQNCPEIHTSTTFCVTLWRFNKGTSCLHINRPLY